MSTIHRKWRCGVIYTARLADLKRGWGKSCSKRCAAVKRTIQERRGNHRPALASRMYPERGDLIDSYHKSIHPFSEEAFTA